MVSVGVAGPAWLAAGWGPHGLWGPPGQRSGGGHPCPWIVSSISRWHAYKPVTCQYMQHIYSYTHFKILKSAY